MGLMRWEPMSELRRMREDMDRMFGDLLSPLGMEMAQGFGPAVDVYEKDNNVIVKAEVPGLSKENLEVTATEDSVNLKGEFKKEEEVSEEGYVRRERRSGRFFRTIPMPSAIKPEEVKASFKEGILEITAPKSEEARARETRIPIET